jgi:hypothetical protein
LDATRQRVRPIGFDHEMNVIPLHREMQNPKNRRRAVHERAANRPEEVRAPKRR